MPLPNQTFTTITQLINYINSVIVPNGVREITGEEHNNVENALANFIVDYTVNSSLVHIITVGGVVTLPAPITAFATAVPTSITWNDDVQNEYYIINTLGVAIPLAGGISYTDQFSIVQASIPAHTVIHIAKATNGSWIQVNNLGPNSTISADAQTILGRYANTAGPIQEITIGSGLSLNATTGVLSASFSGSASNGLSSTGSNIVLGQAVGQMGNPAALTSAREIPMAGFTVGLSGVGAVGIGIATPVHFLDLVQSVTGASGATALNIASTWNTTGNPHGILIDITKVATGGVAKLFTLMVNGTTLVQVDDAGDATFASQVAMSGSAVVQGFIGDNSVPSTRITFNGSGVLPFAASAANLSGNVNIFDFVAGFQPTSGTAIANMFSIGGNINQLGGANGITRGLYVNMTLATAVDFRAIEVASGKSIFLGQVGVGNAAPAISAALEVLSTTQGFLPPRMTTTQKNAISSPGTALLVFDSTLGKYSFFNGVAWETITSA